MSAKKFDLEKNLAKKLDGQVKNGGAPLRFGQGTVVPDRREQRRLDTAAGLVPFACKLPADLAQQLSACAALDAGGMNAVVAALLTQALAANKA
jgi:hypothetical protein